ncbi:Dynein light chain Tctex-type [Coemansia sp. RSA 353]|nr:Dynein light chain Tctex-type [Coemansia sp. RSA 788]KAJ2166613.1 Dynein light chain Tctex-type [Coemansia sp. RSA 562]KAJ2174276.1 Dynein light chain Tctex-type [Coemansia sp. RSA 560]KAJ2197195.1 Dynein light chain Tctex-type [Coemansia sp. RSA 522]KAJ2221404.1 Dynein light chain Tctex-type [Coemansia sp. RSA 520]KAJ2227412.1 Dynein light chain Tctex-type [Coemansia sp. RSA 518]KAJ2248713.1 Dynein light chain Tctex-type [Coemansia sp. RSA 475]KAJ2274989.1 Dynein light chain Tctex-type [
MTETPERGYNTADVYKHLKAAVDMAVGPGEYQHGKLDELHTNIIDYATKKITAIRPISVKVVVTCTIVQNSGDGFHISNTTLWDDSTDSVVTFKFQNQSMNIVVTAYLVHS